MKSVTILFIEFCPISGSTQGLLTQLRVMKERYPHVRSLVITRPHSLFIAEQKKLGFRLYETHARELTEFESKPWETMRSYVSTLILIAWLCIRYRVRLIHCNHYMWSIYANVIGVFLRIPVVIHLKDTWQMRPKAANWLFKCNPSAQYIAVSQYVRRLFISRDFLPKKNITVIYDGIDERIFTCASASVIRKKWAAKRKTIVMMSRIVPERNIEAFIDMAALLTRQYEGLSFVHFGYHPLHSDAEYFAELQAYVQSVGLKNTFRFMPYESRQQNIAGHLRRAFLSVVPAKQFALPNTAIESLLCGTPVVAGNIGGNKEILAQGKGGVLADSLSPLALMRAVTMLFDDEHAYIHAGISGNTFARSRFSAARQYEKIMCLYEKKVGSL